MEKETLDKEISELMLLSSKTIINNMDKKTYEIFILMVKDILKQNVSDMAKTTVIILNALSYRQSLEETCGQGAQEEKQS